MKNCRAKLDIQFKRHVLQKKSMTAAINHNQGQQIYCSKELIKQLFERY